MCGILGIAAVEPVRNRDWLARGCDAMCHRGPDDAGEIWIADGRVGLAHRRLSIIDISPAGHQPMADSTGELLLLFNGEIYGFKDLRERLRERGHRFQSQSDTEVVLAAYREWGSDCVEHLPGMFAFALYDRARQTILLARDRAGEKPLFYTLSPTEVRFSSELKGLMADPTIDRVIEPSALDCYLAFGYVPGNQSILKRVHKLAPANALLFDCRNGSSRVWRYWQLPSLVETPDVSDADLVVEFEKLLEQSVREQLIADVPTGVLLSGGVDSSLVTAMAVRSAPAVKTFTVSFPGHAAYDETSHARLVANHFKTTHLELIAEPSTIDLLPRLARQFDEPMADSSMIPTYLVSKLVREHCTVALGGDGGDELFGGYRHYSRMLTMEKRLGTVPRRVRQPVASAAGALLPVGFKGRSWLQGMDSDFRTDVPFAAPYFDRYTRKALMAGRSDWLPVAEDIRRSRVPTEGDLVQRATRFDFENYMPDDILVKVDRAAMLASLEMRAPFLARPVIEFAFGKVPSRLKATPVGRKILLKKLARKVLPDAFDVERKQGFSVPLPAWLRQSDWKAFFRETLLTDGIFDRTTVSALLEGQAKGRSNSERLFALVMFELWRREYSVSL